MPPLGSQVFKSGRLLVPYAAHKLIRIERGGSPRGPSPIRTTFIDVRSNRTGFAAIVRASTDPNKRSPAFAGLR